jgi:hypothetical protein
MDAPVKRARLLGEARIPAVPRGLEAMADAARELTDSVRAAAERAPIGARPYLEAAEKHLVLAVSSILIAGLAEPDEQPGETARFPATSPRDG